MSRAVLLQVRRCLACRSCNQHSTEIGLNFIFKLCILLQPTVLWYQKQQEKKPEHKLFRYRASHLHALGQVTRKTLHHVRRLPIACLSCLYCERAAPPRRRTNSTQLRNLTRQRKKKKKKRARMNVWQLPVRSRVDCDERKEYKCLICRWVIEGSWAAGLMAASFRDSLWVAPEQDALLQPTAPLTDHGQVLCHTTDAMAPTPSGYHLVGFWFMWFQIIVILHLTRRSCKSALLNIEAWARTWRWSCTGAALRSYFQSQHVTEISPVLMLTFTESQAGHGRDVKRCTRSTNLRGGQMHSAAEQLPVLISARFPNSSWLRAS